ncbi:glutaredoxin family protein [Siminovitchia fortis]|uniref:Glutaredoxin family protein n=1 Tax=Siminovitchia fortis TaxID=254758 RepID=A0A443IS69_9BACI|nr:glutaredoxin family protein [Siminovitchia fortis]RWR09675.1 glutaredoxin family protein [Siminovitchia fortis]WHY83621.1 glutaredoxin family protein [Siminovitchia fortis]
MMSVTVYTTTRCPYCVLLKNFLTEREIPFKEVDVERNPKKMEQLIRKTGQMGVPQTEINGQWIIGFDPGSIMTALQK